VLKNLAENERDISSAKSTANSRQVSPALLVGVSVVYCQRALVDESGMMRTHMGTHNVSEMVAVLGTPWG
jgi:hypothetical protein